MVSKMVDFPLQQENICLFSWRRCTKNTPSIGFTKQLLMSGFGLDEANSTGVPRCLSDCWDGGDGLLTRGTKTCSNPILPTCLPHVCLLCLWKTTICLLTFILHYTSWTRSTWRYWDTRTTLFSSSRRHQTCITLHPWTLTQTPRRHTSTKKEPLHHESWAQPHSFRSKLNSAPKNQVTTTSRSQWEPNPQITQLQCRTTCQSVKFQQVHNQCKTTWLQEPDSGITSSLFSALPHTQESDDVSLAMSCLSDMLLCSLCELSACKLQSPWKSVSDIFLKT